MDAVTPTAEQLIARDQEAHTEYHRLFDKLAEPNADLQLLEDDSTRSLVRTHTSLLRQSSERLIKNLKKLSRKERRIIDQCALEIAKLQASPTGWLGDFVNRIRRALGNPTDEMIETLILPPAYDILRTADRNRLLNKLASTYTDDTSSGQSLNDIIEGTTRLLIGNQLYDAKQLLTLTLGRFPQDLRLYKMMAYVALHDRTMYWRESSLRETLRLFNDIAEPDAEIWALRGDIGRLLWTLNKGDRSVGEQAIVCYVQCFRIITKHSHDRPVLSIGYGIQRAALLSAELYEVESRRTGAHLQYSVMLRQKVQKFSNDLLSVLQSMIEQFPESFESKQNDGIEDADCFLNQRFLLFNRVFAYSALGRWPEMQEECENLIALQGRMNKIYHKGDTVDRLLEYQTQREIHTLARMIVFSGVPIPTGEVESWHISWQSLRRIYATAARSVDITVEIIASMLRGSVGLCFSGGGLRAAFLHLGLLARLAECDILRSVESISAVSGGSLVAAHYYLLVRELLQRKSDEEVTKQDYVDLVKTLIDQFNRGTSTDLLTRIFANPWQNLRVSLGGVNRIHLLARSIHDELLCCGPYEAMRGTPEAMRMRDMTITPAGWNDNVNFSPRINNWCRAAKAPALYLNCTNLNTGHLWRFCVKYMGERADMSGGDLGVDRNTILEMVRYTEVKSKAVRDIPFSSCVGASSLIPALFTPFEIDGLYPDMTVKLVDGAVVDNAGIRSLLHSRTDYVIVNEMGATLPDLNNPSSRTLPVMLRVLDIMQDLNFDKLYRELKDRLATNGVKDACLIHLQQTEVLSEVERESLNYNRRVAALTSTVSSKRLATRQMRHKRRSAAKESVTLEEYSEHSPETKTRPLSPSQASNFEDPFEKFHPKFHFGHVLRSQVASTRTSLDFVSEVEQHAMIATGYKLASQALRRSGRQSKGSQFHMITDVLPPNMRANLSDRSEEPVVNQPSSSEDIRLVTAMLSSMSGCSDTEWGFFDIDAPTRDDWCFTPVKELLDRADQMEISHTHVFDPTSMVFNDHEKLAKELRNNINVENLTDDQALIRLFHQLAVSDSGLAAVRAVRLAPWLGVILALVALGALGGVLGVLIQLFVEFLDEYSFTRRSCWCVLEQPLFFLVLLVLIFLLLLRPAYLTKFVISTIILPFSALLTTVLFNPFLARQGRVANLFEGHDKVQ